MYYNRQLHFKQNSLVSKVTKARNKNKTKQKLKWMKRQIIDKKIYGTVIVHIVVK